MKRFWLGGVGVVAVAAFSLYWRQRDPGVADSTPPTRKSVPVVAAVAPQAPASQPEVVHAPTVTPVQAVPAAAATPAGGDQAPAPERFDGPAVEDDPIPPELPQTPEWKHEKAERVAAVVNRHVERMEKELAEARTRGDVEEVRRLEVIVARYRERSQKLAESLRAK